MSSTNQLFLLSDHIKLSLLERQRAKSLHIDEEAGTGGDSDAAHQQDGHISRSLDQFREGLASLQAQVSQLEESGDATAASDIATSLPALQKQYDDLTSQFHGFSSPSTDATLTNPNSAALAADFAHAQSRKPSKTVRFSDTPSSPGGERDELFDRYRDDPSVRDDSAGYRDHAAQLDNQQLHQYHSQILEEQDEQLDRLGESIGRQRELSMQIGDELDSHVAMLDDVDEVVDRHQTRLDRAKKTLGKVARSAGENKQMTAIVVLIIILILLIAILK